MEDVTELTPQRLREYLELAHKAAGSSRAITPAANHMYNIYKLLLKVALQQSEGLDNEDKRGAFTQAIKVYEREIAKMDQSSQADANTPIDMTLVRRLAQLKRYALAARYGTDFMKPVFHQLGIDYPEADTEYFEESCYEDGTSWREYWTGMFNELREELSPTPLVLLDEVCRLRDQNITGLEPDRYQTLNKVWMASKQLGIRPKPMVRAFLAYCWPKDWDKLRQNPLMSVLEMIDEAGREELDHVRFCLHDDLHELPFIMPEQLRHMIPVLHTIIESLVDTFYDRRHGSENGPVEAWRARGEMTWVLVRQWVMAFRQSEIPLPDWFGRSQVWYNAVLEMRPEDELTAVKNSIHGEVLKRWTHRKNTTQSLSQGDWPRLLMRSCKIISQAHSISPGEDPESPAVIDPEVWLLLDRFSAVVRGTLRHAPSITLR